MMASIRRFDGSDDWIRSSPCNDDSVEHGSDVSKLALEKVSVFL